MSCSIESLPCEECGREVIFFYIRMVTDEEGARKMICAQCAGEEEIPESESIITHCS